MFGFGAHRWTLPLACVAVTAGCSTTIDTVGPDEGMDGGGGTGSTASSGSGASAVTAGATSGATTGTRSSTVTVTASSTTGTFACQPGEIESCYDGDPMTEGVGPCHGGTRTCLPDGSGFGNCEGQHLPALVDNCVTPLDDDCDGTAAPFCTGFLPAPPTAATFGWQSLQEHFIQDGVPCTGEVTVALGDRLLCYAGADDKLYCAGSVYGQEYGPSFVDAGLDGPLQIFVSPTVNIETGNSLCVVLRDGTMQSRGYWNYNGQLGTGDTDPLPEFAPWQGRTDIVRAATGTSDQYCVLTTSGEVHCGGLFFGGPSTTMIGSASSVALTTFGTAELAPADLFRSASGVASCHVRSAGLDCNGVTKGLPGQVVDGGLIGPSFEQGCLLDSSGTVICFDLESILQGTYFAEGQVVALAVNGYSTAVCAVYSDGSLWCMGPNAHGQLGTGDTNPLPVETQVAPPGSVRVGCN